VCLQELAALRQARTRGLDRLIGGLHASRHCRHGARHTGHTGGLEHALGLGAERGELLCNHLQQALGHDVLDRRQGPGHLPLPRDLLEQALVHQRVHHRDQEERMAVRAPVQGLGEGGGTRPFPKPYRQIVHDIRSGAQLQWQFRTLPVQRQVEFERMQGMLPHKHLDRPIRPEHQEAGGYPAPRQIAHQVQRGDIAPVQILEHQDQRLLGRQGLQRLGELPQHAFACGAQHPTLHGFERGRRQQPWHLHQPGGGVLGQRRHQPLAVWPATELSQGVEDRQVRFAGAVVLDTLPPRQPQIWIVYHLRHKGIHDRGLAQPGLACDKPDLPYAAPRPRQPAV
jgi:hypothetical protein